MDTESFWKIRSERYDKLFWTKDDSYIDAILAAGDFKKHEIVLDIGTGTGIIAREIKPYVSHIIALDSSESMLAKGKWEGISFIKWDIAERIFHDSLFDKLVARMVFHHVFDDLDRVFVRCYDLLNPGGKLIVAEGVPPSNDPEVVNWYTEMFKYKEKRRTFVPDELVYFFGKNGFKNVQCHVHMMRQFSIRNWLVNSGLDEENQNKIIDIHLNASARIKKLYNMIITNTDCLIDTKNVIVTGEK
jgi:ubiquinone/menaquinone biosynthesis C-methylase UbiE